MSARELRSLTGGETVVRTRTRLRSGNAEPKASPDTATMSEEEIETGHEDQVADLQQKLAVAGEEMEAMRNELDAGTGQIAELQQKLVMAEEEMDSMRNEQEAGTGQEDQIAELQQKFAMAEEEMETMRRELERTKGEVEQADRAVADAVRDGELQVMKVELERLKQLEEVHQQFDKERERYVLELKRANSTIARLEKELDHRSSIRTGGGGSTSTSVSDLSSVNVNASEASAAGLVRERAPKKVTFVEPEKLENRSPCSVAPPGGAPSGDQSAVVDRSVSNLSEVGGTPPTTIPTDSTDTSNNSTNVGAMKVTSEDTNSIIVQSIAQLIRNQTDMVAAQAKAISAQSLPPLVHFSGEVTKSVEDGFDKWLEQFEERAKQVGWSDEHKKYHLKMLLDKAAFQTFKLLPDSVKVSYTDTVEALKKIFQLVDIEELRGLEFHMLTQETQSIERVGMELQRLAKRAFPGLVGKDLDRLLRGRFYQALLPRWKRKFGAPKTSETFDDLFGCARMLECHEKQYSTSNGEQSGTCEKGEVTEKPTDKIDQKTKELTMPEKPKGKGIPSSRIQCHYCHRFGHIASQCRDRFRRAEAPGRSTIPKALVTIAEFTDEQL